MKQGRNLPLPNCLRFPAATDSILPTCHCYQLSIWPIVLTWQWVPGIWHFNDKTKYLKVPFHQNLAISHRDPRPQIPQPLEPFPFLPGFNTLHIPQRICSSQSTPAAPAGFQHLLTGGDNRRALPQPFTHSIALFFKNTAQTMMLHYRMLL